MKTKQKQQVETPPLSPRSPRPLVVLSEECDIATPFSCYHVQVNE